MKYFHTLLPIFIFLCFYNTTIHSQWVHTTDYFNGGSIRALAVNNINLFTGTDDGVFRSTDNGLFWEPINNGIPERLTWDLTFSGNSLYACSDYIFRTTDMGVNWDTLHQLTGEVFYDCEVNGSAIFVGTNNSGIHRSTDDGNSWIQVNNGLTTNYIKALFVNGNTIFAGGFPGLFRSTDNGENWVELTNGLPSPALNATGFAKIGSNIFASFGGGVYFSTDNGDSWSSTALTGGLVNTIFSYLDNLFAGVANLGVYLSTDYGSSWTPINEGLPSSNYPQDFMTSGGKIFLAAHYDGLYWRDLSELVSGVENISGEIPKIFNLKQNFPNPFNPTTNINFSIAEESYVTLEIFNELGEKVDILISKELTTGNYKYNWYAKNLPSGVYFYQLEAGSFIETKKMILMK
jgi:hypothetical protein